MSSTARLATAFLALAATSCGGSVSNDSSSNDVGVDTQLAIDVDPGDSRSAPVDSSSGSDGTPLDADPPPSDASDAAPDGFDAAAEDGRGPTGLPKSYLPSIWARATVWASLIETIAVDSADRVYVSNGDAVFRIVDGTPAMVVKHTDLPPPTPPLGAASSIVSVAVDDHDALFILRSDDTNAELLSWDGVSTVKLLRSLPASAGTNNPRHLNALGGGGFAFIADEGLFETTPTTLSNDYDTTAMGIRPGCRLESLSMTPTRFAFFSPGCNGSSLLGGKADGSGIGVMARTDDFYVTANFDAFGHDPAGGAVVLVDEKGLYEIGTDRRVTPLPTSPNIFTVGSAESFGLFYSRLAVGTKWRVFIAGGENVYLAEPVW